MATKQKKKLKTKNDKKKYIKRARRALTLEMAFFTLVLFMFLLVASMSTMSNFSGAFNWIITPGGFMTVLALLVKYSVAIPIVIILLYPAILILPIIFVANTITVFRIAMVMRQKYIKLVTLICGIISLNIILGYIKNVSLLEADEVDFLSVILIIIVSIVGPLVLTCVATVLEMKYVIPKGGFSKKDLIERPPRITKKTRKAKNTSSTQDDEEI